MYANPCQAVAWSTSDRTCDTCAVQPSGVGTCVVTNRFNMITIPRPTTVYITGVDRRIDIGRVHTKHVVRSIAVSICAWDVCELGRVISKLLAVCGSGYAFLGIACKSVVGIAYNPVVLLTRVSCSLRL